MFEAIKTTGDCPPPAGSTRTGIQAEAATVRNPPSALTPPVVAAQLFWLLILQYSNFRDCVTPGIRPTEVGGLFKSSLLAKARSPASSNTTHGSGWIVQVQPTERRLLGLLCIPPTAVRGLLTHRQPTDDARR